MASNVEEHILKLDDKFSRKLSAIDAKVNKFRGGIQKTQSSLSGIGALAGRVFVGLGVGLAVKSIASLGIEMEQTRVAFSTFLGSAEKGNKLIAELNQFANITPFNNAEIIKSGRLLLAAGIEADGVTGHLKAIGDVAAGSNVPITELAAIFQKAFTKGKLQAEELNQFAERGIPIIEELAKKFGFKGEGAAAKVFELGSQGKITKDIMVDAFRSMTSDGGIFFNLMEKQSKTVGGRISTLVGKLQLIGITIGEAILPALGVFVDLGLALVNNTKLLGTLAAIVGVAGAAWAIYNVIVGFAAFQTKVFAGAQALLNIVLNANPIGIVVIALAALAAGLLIAWRHSETFRAGIMGLFEVAKTVFANLKRIFTEIPNIIINAIKDVPRAIADTFSGIGNLFSAIFTGDFSAIPGILKKLGTNLIKVNPLAGAALKIGSELGKGVGDSFNKGFDDKIALDKLAAKTEAAGAKAPGQKAGLGGLTTSKTQGQGLKSGLATVRSGAPKNININIDSLIESLVFKTEGLKESAARIKQEVTKVIIEAVNDAQVIGR